MSVEHLTVSENQASTQKTKGHLLQQHIYKNWKNTEIFIAPVQG